MLLSCVVAAAIVTFVGKNNFESNAHESNDLIMANIEALTQSETYFQVRERQTSTCTIHVGAGGQIKLLGGTILKADASGNITFDGQVVCVGSGEIYCRPVECVDLYQVIN